MFQTQETVCAKDNKMEGAWDAGGRDRHGQMPEVLRLHREGLAGISRASPVSHQTMSKIPG
jgi:hypothetical protein